ncbi:protein of unknown function [Candidatus Methylomirabilis oxygeniifera]|uniref:Uncharacterized protein n=1 Tax=Methylomirabilis oxygeniifera TaxID=671143 RepID=D5MN45_METO1|nr:protein of unknown function [Candidatus Methylomirabilis oxyfera]
MHLSGTTAHSIVSTIVLEFSLLGQEYTAFFAAGLTQCRPAVRLAQTGEKHEVFPTRRRS